MRVLRAPLDAPITCTQCGEPQALALRLGRTGHPPHTVDVCARCLEDAAVLMRTLRPCPDHAKDLG